VASQKRARRRWKLKRPSFFGKTKLLPEERPTPMPAEELQADIEKDMTPAACAAPRKPAAVVKKKATARSSTASEKKLRTKGSRHAPW
jgi:hypothetical protein